MNDYQTTAGVIDALRTAAKACAAAERKIIELVETNDRLRSSWPKDLPEPNRAPHGSS